MATEPRIFDTNLFYHIYNRGNRKQRIFENVQDYQHFTEKFIEFRKIYPVDVISYCWMPNHFHLEVRSSTETAISQLISRLCNSHTRYYNVKYSLVGTVFQGRFKSKPVDRDEYFVHLSRYIHLNPTELFSHRKASTKASTKEIHDFAATFPWSSYREYLTGHYKLVNDPSLLFGLGYFSHKDPLGSYHSFVLDGIRYPQGILSNDLAIDTS